MKFVLSENKKIFKLLEQTTGLPATWSIVEINDTPDDYVMVRDPGTSKLAGADTRESPGKELVQIYSFATEKFDDLANSILRSIKDLSKKDKIENSLMKITSYYFTIFFLEKLQSNKLDEVNDDSMQQYFNEKIINQYVNRIDQLNKQGFFARITSSDSFNKLIEELDKIVNLLKGRADQTIKYIANAYNAEGPNRAAQQASNNEQQENQKKNLGFTKEKFNEFVNNVFSKSKQNGILKNLSDREFNTITSKIAVIGTKLDEDAFKNLNAQEKIDFINQIVDSEIVPAHNAPKDKIKIASSILLKNIIKLFLQNIENENNTKEATLHADNKFNSTNLDSIFTKLESTRNDLNFSRSLQAYNITESKVLKEYREEISTLLLPTMQRELKFDKLPTLNFIEDEENAKDMFGRTAHYNPNTSEITVYISGRHPKDIMRSVAHEVVHHAQNCRGEFDNAFNLGEEGYAQSNNHLRKMEKEAYLLGNMLFRDWEDNLKKQRNTTAMINENSLRAKIKQLIMQEMQDASEAENEPAHKYDKNCPCKTCKENKQRRTATNLEEATGRAVQEDKQTMPLNEWRRLELNSLLLNRFGIVSPEVLGEKKKMPMKKDTKDVDGDGNTEENVPAFLNKGDTKKPKAKKGQIPPQLRAHVKGKKHESK